MQRCLVLGGAGFFEGIYVVFYFNKIILEKTAYLAILI